MGEATLDEVLGDLAAILIADEPFAAVLQRIAERALDLGIPAAAVHLTTVDERGHPADEATIGQPSGRNGTSADRLSVDLVASTVTVGTLTLHAPANTSFTDADVATAEAFATQAAVVVTNARAYWDIHKVVEGLQVAMRSRAVIEQAKGKLMARQGVTADEAFERLARASQHENVKLRELARRIVEEDGEV